MLCVCDSQLGTVHSFLPPTKYLSYVGLCSLPSTEGWTQKVRCPPCQEVATKTASLASIVAVVRIVLTVAVATESCCGLATVTDYIADYIANTLPDGNAVETIFPWTL